MWEFWVLGGYEITCLTGALPQTPGFCEAWLRCPKDDVEAGNEGALRVQVSQGTGAFGTSSAQVSLVGLRPRRARLHFPKQIRGSAVGFMGSSGIALAFCLGERMPCKTGQLYQQILGIRAPWLVERVELRLEEGEVHVSLGHEPLADWACPECRAQCPLYDHDAERGWRHLDTCQYRTILHAAPPRIRCPQHGVRVVRLPWAEPHSRFTAFFERLAIDWLQAASQQAVAERLGLVVGRGAWDHGACRAAGLGPAEGAK